MLYLANHHVREWADAKTLQSAQALQENDAVHQLTTDGNQVRAAVRVAGHQTFTRFKVLPDGSVLSDCPCPQSQFAGTVCVHVVATGLTLAARTEDTRKERTIRIAERKQKEKEAREKHAPTPLSGRCIAEDAKDVAAKIRLRVSPSWQEDIHQGHSISISCRIEVDGKRNHPERMKPGRKLTFSPEDLELLYILEDIAGTKTCPSHLVCSVREFADLLYALQGKKIAVMNQEEALRISESPALSALQLSLDPSPPHHLLLTHTSLPEGEVVLALPKAAWLLHHNTLYALDAILPEQWRQAYKAPLRIPPHHILRFIRHTLPSLRKSFPLEDETGYPENITISPGTPSFVLQMEGGLDSLNLALLANYANTYFPVTRDRPDPNDAIPDPQNPLQFIGRNFTMEAEAHKTFVSIFGQQRQDAAACYVSGQQDMLAAITDSIPKAEEQGWKIERKSAFATSCQGGSWIETELHITPFQGEDYRIEMQYRDEAGNPVSADAVEAAVIAGNTIITEMGRNLILDAAELRSLQAALAECTEYRDTVPCITRIHAGFIATLCAQNKRLHVTAPQEWNQHAQQMHNHENLPDVTFSPSLTKQLRGYQKEGIRWINFLDHCQYAGILADEMGLGKTVQALAWLEHRKKYATEKRPAIVICPTSLLVNWAREVERFVPDLTYCIISGANRHTHWGALHDYDIIITSYALLRRDSNRYTETHFSAVILDEAQHIKNRSTQNAIAAKRLQADRRLVLTGTPIENSVSDLWSIMDFLMPGYLGTHNSFRIRFEQPVQNATSNSDKALEHLRCKLSPFMLRRLKLEVAAEMPAKVNRIASTPMLGPQKKLYNQLLSSYYEQITSLVDSQGFERSRFSVFSALLRLRQCCCHPALLKQIKGSDEMASAKTDLFFELLDEAMDGGHRVLVFSQFVQMLHILRTALKKRNIPFAYLDGSTRNRMEQVDAFNNNADIPVFLVSLKAGGSGLNLTGANVVIHYDPWWNPAVEDQATDRTHRIGQTQTVYSIKLVMEDSIEQKVINLQQRKRQIINATMGASGGFAQQLTWDDIRQLLQPV